LIYSIEMEQCANTDCFFGRQRQLSEGKIFK
jgi:hypothetical protein